jgi:hypothetical protein
MKKPWQAPQLIILTRSKPEEAVLDTCKTADLKTTPGDFLDGCYFFANAVCAPCYDYGDS